MIDDFAGQVFDEKYRIARKLGEGGMGAVYLATHVGTKRPVALKLIVPRFVASEEFLERFRREAEAAGRLRHPNVVDVTDFGLTTVAGDRTAYLVMEYLDGESLRALIKRESALPIDFVADVLEQAALAVDLAHRNGVLHRDLKPDNIWLEPDGRGGVNVKVLDFGLAKLHGGDAEPARTLVGSDATRALAATSGADESGLLTLALGSEPSEATASGGEITRAGTVLGTPAYMSPEQCRGAEADGRSDVYSLAVVAYEMLAGELPFQGPAFAVIIQHATAEPPSLAARRPRLTAGIADLVARAMAKEPARRPATAGAFAAALRARTVTGGQVLRRAVALYSEHFSAFLRLSLFGNLPLLAIAAALFLAIPFVRVGVWQAALFCGCMLLGIFYPYATNRATFAIALDRLRRSPLSRLDAGEVLDELAGRLGVAPGAGRLRLAARMFALAPRSSKLVLAASVPAQMIERLDRREANARSRLLLASVPEALRTVALFGSLCYAVPTGLFFLATLGVTQALGVALSTATSVSFAVAIAVMGVNVVWLIPPAHIALVSLYFLAREASGEG